MNVAIVLGGAVGVWEELSSIMAMLDESPVIIGTNHAGRDFPGYLDHWVSYHVELLPMWIEARERAGLPPAGAYWSVQRSRPASTTLEVRRVKNHGGSSGLVAVDVALELGCDRVVVCGCPLEMAAAHYDNPASWRDANNYKKAWRTRQSQMGAVRSMSGFTREILGAPTKEWLNEGQEGHRHGRVGVGSNRRAPHPSA